MKDFAAALIAFVLCLIAYAPFIRRLSKWELVQPVREEGPSSHRSKKGTPTGGGALMVVVVALIVSLIDFAHQYAFVAALLLGGLLGGADDLAKSFGTSGYGIRARYKILLQLVCAAIIAVLLWISGRTYSVVPRIALNVWFWPLSIFSIVATANAVNLTDGSDGLAASVVLFALLGFIALSVNSPYVLPAACLIGAVFAFLWFNRHPAKVFMGDVGSLSIGMASCTLFISSGLIFLLPLVFIVPVIETLSVIIQVGCYKLTGRRVFPMTPIHHSLHLKGWSENAIAGLFSVGSILGSIAAFITIRA